jgi:1-acyl-sn-glycerol-3-phosphate acyltransferase
VKHVPLYVPADRWFYRTVRALSGLTLCATYRLSCEGAENLPTSGAAIIAANHKSNLDPFFVGHAFPRPVRYFAKSELFRNSALRWAVTELGAIPVRRGQSNREALDAALAALAAGDALIIYPEGHRMRDDDVHEFLPGVGMLALRSGAPVIPVGLKGSGEIVRDGRPGLPVVRVKAGAAVDLSGLEGKRSEMYVQAAARIREAVEALYASF